jgi:hypothetical protein
LKGNGGLEPLDIYDEALVPDDYCTATVTLPWNLWLVLRESISVEDFPKSIRSVDSAAVRKALAEPCWVCEGTGQGNDIGTDRDGEAISGSCTSCGGSGKAGVPGCALRDRGFHLEIR